MSECKWNGWSQCLSTCTHPDRKSNWCDFFDKNQCELSKKEIVEDSLEELGKTIETIFYMQKLRESREKKSLEEINYE